MPRLLKDDLSIVLAGEAGQGIQSIEAMLTAFAKKASYHVFATKEYMSRVRGGCNSTELRISCGRVSARLERIDILVPLIPEAIPHLGGRVTRDTLVLGDPSVVAREGMLALPLTALATEAGSPIYSNTVAVGAICALLGIDPASCEAGMAAFFPGKAPEVVEGNRTAFRLGHRRGLELAKDIVIEVCRDDSVLDDIMLTGAEAISLGALSGGCDFVCAYPMSPGTSVLQAMAAHSRDFDILVEQVEDEIGVANMALGAWYAGARALVTTSGGGFALMSEAVSLSGGIETPMVVHIAQRPGPATGLPTRTEQGDLDLAIHAGHGDFLRIVLAPGDLDEGYELAREAFSLADHWQSPVFILTDQYFVDSYYTTRPFAAPAAIPRPATVETGAGYRRYALGSPDGLSPRGLPGKGRGLVRVDSDEHDEEGHITEDAGMRKAMVEKRLAKLAAARRAALPPRLYGEAGHRVLVLAWGSTKQPILEALARLGRKDLALLHFPQVWPLPEEARAFLERADRVIAVEGNATGQFADIVEQATGRRMDARVLKYDGFQFSVEELMERLAAAAGPAVSGAARAKGGA
jgi:2-oxoglutarate ferredoxin oxidoreductase subunit alpha